MQSCPHTSLHTAVIAPGIGVLTVCQEPSKVLLHALCNSISTKTLQYVCYYSCFTDKKTKTQRRKVTSLRSHDPSWGCDFPEGKESSGKNCWKGTYEEVQKRPLAWYSRVLIPFRDQRTPRKIKIDRSPS